jgi:hypothetical protein
MRRNCIPGSAKNAKGTRSFHLNWMLTVDGYAKEIRLSDLAGLIHGALPQYSIPDSLRESKSSVQKELV